MRWRRHDGPPVERLREAGAIGLGRTNLPDVALRWHTDSSIAGATLNPWNAAISPGGSSGGEAVAVATGISPLGIGTDVGGSVRIPASACGVVSLKPTWGRIADVSVVAPPPTRGIARMDTTGPLARSVADLRAAFDVLSRPSDRDPRYREVGFPERRLPTRFAVVIPGRHAPRRARGRPFGGGCSRGRGLDARGRGTARPRCAVRGLAAAMGDDVARRRCLSSDRCAANRHCGS